MGSVLCMLGLGTIYTWSLFNHAIATEFGWRVEDIAFTFAVMSISLSVASLASGKLEKKFGIRMVASICGVVLGLGLFLASRVTNLTQLYLTAGVMVGAADGIAYLMILSNCIRWFPLNKGLVSGIAIGAYGIGSLAFKYVNMALLQRGGTHLTFGVWGACVIGLVGVGAWLLHSAPPFPASTAQKTARQSKNMAHADFTWKEMLRTRQAWLLFVVFISCCMSGLFLISVAKDLATQWAGLSMVIGAGAVTTVAIANTLGRLVLGQLSDSMTRIHVVSLITLSLFVAAALLATLPPSVYLFFFCAGLMAFGFGGAVSVFPALIGDFFGLEHMTKNYSIIYQGFGLGAVVGSFISVWLGGFLDIFILIAFLNLISLIITLTITKPNKPALAV